MSEEQQDPIEERVARLLGYYGVLVQGGSLAPDQYTLDEIEGIVAAAAALRVSLANEMRRRWAAEDERDQHEEEWSAELATLRAERDRLAADLAAERARLEQAEEERDRANLVLRLERQARQDHEDGMKAEAARVAELEGMLRELAEWGGDRCLCAEMMGRECMRCKASDVRTFAIRALTRR